MKIASRDFGIIETDEQSILTFQQPILGFEEYRKFVLIYDEEVGKQFAWLQSAESVELCFILFDPTSLQQQYQPDLPDNMDEMLEGQGEYECWVLASVGQDFSKTTVNLKSPIIICNKSCNAAQIVLEQAYPIRFPLFEEEK